MTTQHTLKRYFLNSSLHSYVQEQSSNAGMMGFVGGVVGAALVIGVLKRRR